MIRNGGMNVKKIKNDYNQKLIDAWTQKTITINKKKNGDNCEMHFYIVEYTGFEVNETMIFGPCLQPPITSIKCQPQVNIRSFPP